MRKNRKNALNSMPTPYGDRTKIKERLNKTQ